MNKEKKIDFIIAGTAKGGTTSMWHYLKQHPSCFLPEKKELELFNKHYDDINSLLERHYGEADSNNLWGEASPRYMTSIDGIRNTKNYNSNMKWIFMLRDPADRAYSQYHQELKMGYHNISTFEKALEVYPRYINNGKYYQQLMNVLNEFPKESTHIIFYEDFSKELELVFNRVLRFLNLKDIELQLDQGKNRGRIVSNKLLHKILMQQSTPKDFLKRLIPERLHETFYYKFMNLTTKEARPEPMSLETRKLIINEVLDDIEKLEKMTLRDLTNWKN